MSKAHPNQSTDYKAKMRRREQRTFERSLLVEAKAKFQELYPNMDATANRSKLAYLKFKLRQILAKNPHFSFEQAKNSLTLRTRQSSLH